MRRRLTLLSMVVLLVLLVGSGYYVLPRAAGERVPFIPGGISLVRPAIAQENGASFLDTDAGMSAYSDAGLAINLSNARAAFRIIERETASSIVGTVAVASYDENEDPHVYVHESGWIIAYYDKDSPVGRSLHWAAHGSLGVSKLEQALEEVANSAGVPVQNVGYFDFRYPAATEWLLIVDGDSFDVTIPDQFVVAERSYSHYTTHGNCAPSIRIDAILVSTDRCVGTWYSQISPSILSTGVAHTIVLPIPTNNSMAISLLYSPPAVQ